MKRSLGRGAVFGPPLATHGGVLNSTFGRLKVKGQNREILETRKDWRINHGKNEKRNDHENVTCCFKFGNFNCLMWDQLKSRIQLLFSDKFRSKIQLANFNCVHVLVFLRLKSRKRLSRTCNSFNFYLAENRKPILIQLRSVILIHSRGVITNGINKSTLRVQPKQSPLRDQIWQAAPFLVFFDRIRSQFAVHRFQIVWKSDVRSSKLVQFFEDGGGRIPFSGKDFFLREIVEKAGCGRVVNSEKIDEWGQMVNTREPPAAFEPKKITWNFYERSVNYL